MKIETIIFDLDGTLMDSSEGIVEAFNYALGKFHLPIQPAERITPMIGFPVENMFSKFNFQPGAGLKNAFRAKAMETVVKASEPLAGAEEVIKSLFNEGFNLGIATTKIRAHIEGILAKLDWVGYFNSFIGGDEVLEVKPHPEQIETLMGRMGTNNKVTVVVGDTINDILAARQLGITEIAIRSPYGNSLSVQQLKPQYFLEGIDELPEILSKLNYPRIDL